MSREEVYERLVETLAMAFNRPSNGIGLASRFQADLGAESIDLLHLLFLIEREFRIRFVVHELLAERICGVDPDCINDDGTLTAAGVADLKQTLPCANFSVLGDPPQIKNISNLYTVGVVYNHLLRKLGIA